jgi:hypothetical protein
VALLRFEFDVTDPRPSLLRRIRMFDLLIIVVMLGILVSLGAGLFFLVRDRGQSERTVISLSIRVALSVLLLMLLAWGFVRRFLPALQ